MQAPYLILSFCRPVSTRTLFVDAANALADWGCHFSSWTTVTDHGEEFVGSSLSSFDEQIRTVESSDIQAAVEARLNLAACGLDRESVFGYVDYSGLRPESRIVALSISAPEFAHIPNDRTAHMVASPAVELFLRLCTRLSPLYASLTVDYDLETPEQLEQDPRSYAFSDFYVDSDFLTGYKQELLSLVEGSFVEPVHNGIYISGTRYFNPDRKSLMPSSATASSQVARLLVRCFRSRGAV